RSEAHLPYSRFYERGCQHKHLTADRPPDRNLSLQPALSPWRRFVESSFVEIRSLITTWCRLQKLKSDAAADDRRPRFYLSLDGLLLFQVVRGGIEYLWGLRPKPWATDYTDPHPRPYAFRAHRRRSVEFIVLPANRSKRLCRRIQFLGIERFSFLPNSQRNCDNLARQRQPRHLGPYPPLPETLNVTPVRFPPATGTGPPDDQLL